MTLHGHLAVRQPRHPVQRCDPGYTATDLNGHRGPNSVEDGAEIIVRMAVISADGTTGGFFDQAVTSRTTSLRRHHIPRLRAWDTNGAEVVALPARLSAARTPTPWRAHPVRHLLQTFVERTRLAVGFGFGFVEALRHDPGQIAVHRDVECACDFGYRGPYPGTHHAQRLSFERDAVPHRRNAFSFRVRPRDPLTLRVVGKALPQGGLDLTQLIAQLDGFALRDLAAQVRAQSLHRLGNPQHFVVKRVVEPGRDAEPLAAWLALGTRRWR
ncbi:MAG: hypothetical protein QOF84_1865 [Streptomyces sp.]|jgi:hypothetical protein|nr:hypothetical protein [Streptomyces sp.]